MSLSAAAIAPLVSLRAFSGQTILTLDATDVDLPSYGLGEGTFEDVITAANGRGTDPDEALGLALVAGWTGAGTLAYGFDSAGRLYLEASAEDFEIEAGAGNAWWGFDADGHGLVGGVAPYRRTAPRLWQAGPAFSPELTVNPAAAAAYSVGADRWWPDLITALRDRGIGDDDDQAEATCIEALIIGATLDTTWRFGPDADGYMMLAWKSGTLAATTTDAEGHFDPWGSAAIRAAWGYSGLEVVQTLGDVEYLRASYPCPGLQVFADGLESYEPRAWQSGTATELIGGGHGAADMGTLHGCEVKASIRGPVAEDASLYQHWLTRVVPRLPRGGACTLYPEWGRPLRRLLPFGVTAEQPAHDLVYTTAPAWDQGMAGRRRCEVGVQQAQEWSATWPDARTWWEITLILKDAP